MTTTPDKERPTLMQVVRVAADIANEQPDHVDTSQRHRQDNGEPGCLTGVVLHRLGLLDTLAPYDEDAGGYGDGDGQVQIGFTDYFGDETGAFLEKLQEHQDEDEPWQRAFFAACQDEGIRVRVNPKP